MIGACHPRMAWIYCITAGHGADDGDVRDYERHWTPLHLDWVVEDIGAGGGWRCWLIRSGMVLPDPVRRPGI